MNQFLKGSPNSKWYLDEESFRWLLLLLVILIYFSISQIGLDWLPGKPSVLIHLDHWSKYRLNSWFKSRFTDEKTDFYSISEAHEPHIWSVIPGFFSVELWTNMVYHFDIKKWNSSVLVPCEFASINYRIFLFQRWFKLRTFSMALMTLAFNCTSRALPLFLKYFMNLAWIKILIQIENSNPESEGALPLLVLKSETHSNMLSQKIENFENFKTLDIWHTGTKQRFRFIFIIYCELNRGIPSF